MGHTNYCAGNHCAGNIVNPQGLVHGRQVPLKADIEGIFRTLIMRRSPSKIGTPLPYGDDESVEIQVWKEE